MALCFLLTVGVVVAAPESPTPQPPPSTSVKPVQINFLPPPLEGTISLGIYDSSGKLVRILHREAELEAFEVQADGLETTWDGKDDHGAPSSPGKYHARGFAVGDLDVEGVGFFFNDWITDEQSPRILKVHNLRPVRGGNLAMLVTFADGTDGSAMCDVSGNLLPRRGNEAGHEDERFLPDRSSVKVESGKLSFQRPDEWEEVSWPSLVAPQAADLGRDGTVWIIDRDAPNAETVTLKQLSEKGEFLRRMTFPANGPQPKIVQASPSEEKIYLLEEGLLMQRVRRLSRLPVASPEINGTFSDWKVDLEKKIIRHKDFTIENGTPSISSGGKSPPEKIALVLKENPLQDNKKGSVELAVGYDASGSFLKTADGLPLQTISETRNLTRVVLSPQADKSIEVFQDDDAVVEQFRIRTLDEMMAFDCGEIELK